MTKRGILVYDHYSFKDQDPCVDSLRMAMRDTGTTPIDIQNAGKVAPKAATINNWLNKKVRCPRHDTFCAAMGVMGYRQEWVQSRVTRRRVANG